MRLVAALIVALSASRDSEAAWSTVLDNGPATNRVDIIFVGDGYTQADLEDGLYSAHVQSYIDYMFGAPDYLTDPFPRYKNFFNVHQIDVQSAESGADHPSEGIFRNTALDATYETSGIDRLLTINTGKANTVVTENLVGTGITADIRLATVNDSTYGGSGGTWAVYAGPNNQARDIALHELSHAFSKTEDEYVTKSGAYPGGEPSAVNVTTDSAGTKWSHWLEFDDPRAEYLDVGVFEGADDYPFGIYRPSLDSKMRTLNRPFNAVVREKSILDIYERVDPLDAWRDNSATVMEDPLWVDTVDTGVIAVDWYVDDVLIAPDHGEKFDLGAFDFGAATYDVRAHAYDRIVAHAGDGSLNDLVRKQLGEFQQNVEWTVEFAGAAALPGDYNLDRVVDEADHLLWKDLYGSTVELAADGNGDGIVDAADYTIWRNNFGNTWGGGGYSSDSVPEPNVAILLCGIVPGLSAVVRRRL